jgi:hypothetical protein
MERSKSPEASGRFFGRDTESIINLPKKLPTLFGLRLLLLTLFLSSTLVAADNQTPRTSNVGRTASIEQIILPGSELKVKRLEGDSPIVVRIIDTFPHGPDQFRYDIEYYGLDPGDYDLTDYFKRVDGSLVGVLPELKVTIQPLLAAGQVEPHRLPQPSLPSIGGYRNLLVILGIGWVVGLFLILFVGRGRKHQAADGVRTITLAERLRPMVADAIAGKLNRQQYAELEMSLVAFWRKKLGKENATAATAIIDLKNHEEAGPLLRQLEKWLHEPGQSDRVDVAELLKPYEKLPANALDPVEQVAGVVT